MGNKQPAPAPPARPAGQQQPLPVYKLNQSRPHTPAPAPVYHGTPSYPAPGTRTYAAPPTHTYAAPPTYSTPATTYSAPSTYKAPTYHTSSYPSQYHTSTEYASPYQTSYSRPTYIGATYTEPTRTHGTTYTETAPTRTYSETAPSHTYGTTHREGDVISVEYFDQSTGQRIAAPSNDGGYSSSVARGGYSSSVTRGGYSPSVTRDLSAASHDYPPSQPARPQLSPYGKSTAATYESSFVSPSQVRRQAAAAGVSATASTKKSFYDTPQYITRQARQSYENSYQLPYQPSAQPQQGYQRESEFRPQSRMMEYYDVPETMPPQGGGADAGEVARQAFRKFDGDGNGFLDIYEFMAAMKELGMGTTFGEAQNIFSQIDVDGGGSIEEQA